jgi:hypothetical protein
MLHSLQELPTQQTLSPLTCGDLENKKVLVLQADFHLGNPLGKLTVRERPNGKPSVYLQFEWYDRGRSAMVVRRFLLTELQMHRLIPCDLPSVANFEYAGILEEEGAAG